MVGMQLILSGGEPCGEKQEEEAKDVQPEFDGMVGGCALNSRDDEVSAALLAHSDLIIAHAGILSLSDRMWTGRNAV